MERINVLTFRTVNYFLDFVCLTAAFSLGCIIWWSRSAPSYSLSAILDINVRILLVPYLLFYLCNFVFLASVSAYRSSRLQTVSSALTIYVRSICFSLLMLAIANTFFPFVPVSRTLLVATGVIAFSFLWIKEKAVRTLLRSLRERGAFVRRSLIVGSNTEHIQRLVAESLLDDLLGIQIAGVVYPKLEAAPEELASQISVPVVGDLRDFVQLVDTHRPDLLILFGRDLDTEVLQEALWICEERGLEAWIKLEILERVIYQARLESLEGIPFITLHGGPLNPAALLVKYIIDRVVSFLALLVLLPLLIVVAALIRLTSPGPIFFKQRRVGRNGRIFHVFKFRSMIIGAEEQKEALQDQNEMTGPVFKLTNDPRITPFGRFIRKTSIDELPQLWNVVRGEMSLVGPRPLPIEEAEQLTGWHRRRLSMRPGITCIWQVAGRNEIREFDDWAQMDLEYIDNWSLWLDFALLIQTIPVVIFGRGAS